jgi:hypothetical protein
MRNPLITADKPSKCAYRSTSSGTDFPKYLSPKVQCSVKRSDLDVHATEGLRPPLRVPMFGAGLRPRRPRDRRSPLHRHSSYQSNIDERITRPRYRNDPALSLNCPAAASCSALSLRDLCELLFKAPPALSLIIEQEVAKVTKSGFNLARHLRDTLSEDQAKIPAVPIAGRDYSDNPDRPTKVRGRVAGALPLSSTVRYSR